MVLPAGSVGDKTYTAVWSTDEYEVTYYVDGAVVGKMNVTHNAHADTETKRPEVAAGYSFDGWYLTNSRE